MSVSGLGLGLDMGFQYTIGPKSSYYHGKERKQIASAGLEHKLFKLRSKHGELYILIIKKARVS